MRSTIVRGFVAMGMLPIGALVALADEDFQHGEAIVAASQAAVDAPIRRHPKALWYELSNLRKDDSFTVFGRGEIALDFRRDNDDAIGWHEVVMVVKTKNGRREYRAHGHSPFADLQGTVHGVNWFGSLRDRDGDQFEVWLEQHQYLGAKTIRIKVSKSLTLGNFGQLTLARQWNEEEQKLFQNWEKSTTPPPAPPAGYQVAVADTNLLRGMPILAGWMGEWKPAEVIDLRKDGTVLVKYPDSTTLLMIRSRSWIAVEDKTLEAGRANPLQFQASVKVLPGGTVPVPADLRPIESDTPLVKGVPLKADWGGKWSTVTVVELQADGKLRVRWDDWAGNWEEDRDRASLLITPETLEALKKPGATEEFAKRGEKKLAKSSFGSGRMHDYPINIPIPENAVRVTEGTPLEEGTKLGCSWGKRWFNVTVLKVNDGDIEHSVNIRWDDFGRAKDGDVSRENLIIDKEVLAKLQEVRKADPSRASKDANSGEDRFKIVLTSFGANKIAVIKAVADVTGLELKDAKEFVESVPVTIKQNLTKAAAEKLRAGLQDAGGKVAIELQ